MLDVDALFANEVGTTEPNLPSMEKQTETIAVQGNTAILEGGSGSKVGLSGLIDVGADSGELSPRESLSHNGFRGLGSVGSMVSLSLEGGDTKTGYRVPGGGTVRNDFALHPAAVILLIAYCRATDIDPKEQAELLIELGQMAPGDQVRLWQTACIDKGIEPWRLLTIPASLEGHDCSLCTHLLTRQYAEANERRQYHWACGKGYLILETGRGTERIWIAPPECTSWDRWYPSDMR